jgi:hypothetical protein
MKKAEGSLQPPSLDPSIGDAVNRVARATVAVIPIVGDAAAELLDAVFTPPLVKRQQAWRESMATAVERLRSEVKLDVASLSSNETFIDTVLQASHIAIRTSQEEKLKALRAAVFNAALPGAPEAALQQIFLGYVDALTDWHLRLLALFDNPRAWYAARSRTMREHVEFSSLAGVLREAFPELGARRDFYDRIWADLWRRGLVDTDQLHAMMTPQGAAAQRTTSHGQSFLRFITERP